MGLVEKWLGELLGKIYVSRYFSEQDKTTVRGLIEDVLAVMEESLRTNDWLTQQTKGTRERVARARPGADAGLRGTRPRQTFCPPHRRRPRVQCTTGTRVVVSCSSVARPLCTRLFGDRRIRRPFPILPLRMFGCHGATGACVVGGASAPSDPPEKWGRWVP